MSEPLTQLERQVYHYMIDFLAENTYQPSIREIARQFRIKSTKTVSDLLHALETKGYIEREESRSRGVRILGFSATGNTQPVPFYAQVHAGTPALLPEHRTHFITMDRRFLASEDAFYVRVKGNGLASRAIVEGDYVLVTPGAPRNDGCLVAVRVGADAMVKVCRLHGEAVVLEGTDAADAPISVSSTGDVAVLGTVSGVFRPLHEQEPPPVLPMGGVTIS